MATTPTTGQFGYERLRSGPLVSVLIATFNRPRYLAEAIASVVRQSYRNIEIIVVNDGGQDVSDVVGSFNDDRLVFINRKENHGKAFSLNEALARAGGKYVAYLDDDDLYYPNHVEVLVNALEGQTDCQAAYSDLYKAHCNVMPDGTRVVLSKIVEITRDFDRFFMLYFNHVLHVSLVHRRDLIEKTGLYNERLNILIDWDMTRRLVFFTDFCHVHTITGEFYGPIGECDRISVQRRKDKSEYLRNVLAIRTTRPAKPWPKLEDLSIILILDRLDAGAARTIGSIWRSTFYPYKLYLPLPPTDVARLNTDMPNAILIPVNPMFCEAEKLDVALRAAEGEYVAVVAGNIVAKDMWVENPLYALMNSPTGYEGFEMDCVEGLRWGAVVRKAELAYARRSFMNLPVPESLQAAGIRLRRPRHEELPFQFDDLIRGARLAEGEGNWAQAAKLYRYISEHHRNGLWMKSLAARALYRAGDHQAAGRFCQEVNQQQPTVETLLLEAKIDRKSDRFAQAITLLTEAEQILAGQTPDSHNDRSCQSVFTADRPSHT